MDEIKTAQAAGASILSLAREGSLRRHA